MPGGYHSSTKPGSAQLEVPTRMRPLTRLRIDDRVFVAWEKQLGHLAESVRAVVAGLEDPHDVEPVAGPGLRYPGAGRRGELVRYVRDRVVLPADEGHVLAGGR